MKKTTKICLLFSASLYAATLAFSVPPKSVADMDKKELKTYKRDVKEYSFETQVTKDKDKGITWVQSPVVSDHATPLLKYFFRTAIKDGKPVGTYIFVTHTRPEITDFNKAKSDYTVFKLGNKQLVTRVGEAITDVRTDTVTQQSTIITTIDTIRLYKDSGMHLKAVNAYGETEVPIKASLVTAFVNRVEKTVAKASK